MSWWMLSWCITRLYNVVNRHCHHPQGWWNWVPFWFEMTPSHGKWDDMWKWVYLISWTTKIGHELNELVITVYHGVPNLEAFFFGTPTGFFDTVILSSHSFGVIFLGSQYIAVAWKIHRKQVVHYPCCIPRFAWEWLLFWSNYIFSRKYLDVFWTQTYSENMGLLKLS